MPIVQDGFAPLEFLISEASGQRSRERATVKAGSGVLQPGRVMAIESATSKLVPFNPTGTGGAQVPRAILGYSVDATAGDVLATVFARDCEVASQFLVWGTSDANAIAAAAAELASGGVYCVSESGAHVATLSSGRSALSAAQAAAGATGIAAVAEDPVGGALVSALAINRGRVMSAPGTTVLDFGLGSSIATSTATQSSCAVTWNPTGWPDGTGCLEIVPNSDAFSEFRLYFDASKQFDLWSDDGYALEWIMPNIEDKPANPGAALTIGRGAAGTGTPTDTRSVPMHKQATGTVYRNGRDYTRWRWDFTTTDAKAGPWPGYAATTTGVGISKADTINWIRFEFTRFGGKTIKIKRLVRGGRARPCLVLGTDAAAFYPLSELTNAWFAQNGLRWSINQYFGGGTGVDDLARSRAVIASVYAAGSDFNVNDLIDRPLATAGLSQQQAYDVAMACQSKARAYGWRRGSNVHIWNNNSYNDTVIAGFQAAGIVAARGGNNDGRFVFTEGGVTNPMRIPAASWDQLTTAAMTTQVDRVIEYGATQWAYWHNVYSTARITDDGQAAVGAATPSAYASSNPTYCTPRGINALTVWWEELKGGLDYIKAKETAGLLDVMTPSQWCQAHGIAATL